MSEEISYQKHIERERARFAYECAERGKDLNKSKEYKAYIKKIPMLIKSNGLASALAFVKAKSTTETSKAGYAYYVINEQLTQWLKQEPKGILSDKLNNNVDLVKAVLELNSDEYRAVTNEVLAFLTWLKRFAEGLIEGEADED
jgi:CRISPR-associated protein Cmr5